MTTNSILKYTDLDYPAILTQITNNIASDPNFDNVRDSAISQTIMQIFAATTDMITYYLKRRAEECFIDTAKLQSSAILLSRQLGYVVTRPIPATTTLKIILKGDFTGLFTAGDKLQIPINSSFTYNGNNYILKNTYSYTLQNPDVYNLATQGASYYQELTVDDFDDPITLVQGEIREQVISGQTNPQIGQKFQLYKLGDTQFSNIYGDQDYSTNITKVWVGNAKTDPNEYQIDRRSLINYQNINNGNFLEDSISLKICVIRTAIDGDVEIKFGDGKFADYGAQSNSDDIFIQYLATIGSKANQVGVINNSITFGGNLYNKTGVDITDLVSFKLNSNITGGSDLEDIESIKAGTPAIYSSLDRLVSKDDYVNFLNHITSPIAVKNSIAWGEQEEIELQNLNSTTNKVIAIQALFNVVLFCCVGSLYEIGVSPHYVKTVSNGLEEAVLDVNFDENEFTGQSYFNIYTKNNVVEQLQKYSVSEPYFELQTLTSPSPTSAFNSTYLTPQYGSNAVLEIDYTSNNLNESYNVSGAANITLDFSTFITPPTGTSAEFLSEIASKIQTQLQTVIDQRGGNSTINTNYSQLAFPNITVSFVTSANNGGGSFYIDSAVSDPCYVIKVVSNNTILSTQLGFNNFTVYPLNKDANKEISGKITEVISLLSQKAQPTVKHVYVSPIIQDINLIGNVYVNSLYDINSVKTQVEDAVYEWLDSNADFNVPIYKSNILDVIEGFTGVKYADIQFSPDIPSETPFYSSATGGQLSATFDYYNNYYSGSGDIIRNDINFWLNSYITTSAGLQSTSASIPYNGNVLQNYNLSWNNFINERNFYTYFLKGVHNDLVGISATSTPGTLAFVNSSDFFTVISGIHKDLLGMIRFNMLDSNGNIDRELDANGNYYKGGYSLGNEIVKMNINLAYSYVTIK